ncbi:hypothetical protein Tco_1542167, partial [Tanacetum coccineum]
VYMHSAINDVEASFTCIRLLMVKKHREVLKLDPKDNSTPLMDYTISFLQNSSRAQSRKLRIQNLR